jgi:hypothetical protein
VRISPRRRRALYYTLVFRGSIPLWGSG